MLLELTQITKYAKGISLKLIEFSQTVSKISKLSEGPSYKRKQFQRYKLFVLFVETRKLPQCYRGITAANEL